MGNKYGEYKVHPAAALFPLLNDDELDSLAADIFQNGLSEPIVLTNDGTTIVDGRLRWRACMEARVDPVFRKLPKHYTEDDIVLFIVTKNMMRRDLDPGQRAMIVIHLAPMLSEKAKERQVAAGKEYGRKQSFQ
jgi:ParB-like chromosome segregation protein Spo0J